MFSQLVSLASLIAGWYCSSHYYTIIAERLPESYGPWRDVGAMILVFILVNIIVRLAGKILNKMVNTVVGGFNRQLGALLGLVRGFFICMLVTFFAVMGGDTTKAYVINSSSGRFMIESIAFVQKYIPEDETHDDIERAINEFRAKAGNTSTGGSRSQTPDKNQGTNNPNDIWSILKSKTQSGDTTNNSQTTSSGNSEFGEKVVSWFKSAAGVTEASSPASSEKTASQNSDSTQPGNIPNGNQSATSSLQDLINSVGQQIINQTAASLTAQLNDVVTDNSTAKRENTESLTGNMPRTSTIPQTSAAVVQIDTTNTVGYGSILDRQNFSPESIAPPF